MAGKLSKARERFLTDLFPGDGCVLSEEGRTVFGADSSRNFALPDAVVRPRDARQVCELLRWADAEGVPICPRSRGTGMAGGAVPLRGGVVVSMLRMNRVAEISPDDFVAVVEPGVVTADFQKACAQKGLFYPPDPASLRISTLGGNAATCAGGMRALKYGVTRDYVLGLDAAVPGGDLLSLGGRTHKNVVGLDLARLFVGSQGTLGIVTKLVLKLLPLPETSASLLAGFSSLRAALEGARAVFGAGILPTAMEFMDEVAMGAVRTKADIPLPENTRAALLLKLDGPEATLDFELKKLDAVMRRAELLAVRTGRGADEEELWEVRRLISPASFTIRPNKLSEDVAVPRGRTVEAVEGFRAVGERFGVPVLCFGHLGDGNIHVNIMHDAADERELAAAQQAKAEVFALALTLGGTLSGEHGTGMTKRDYLHLQLGEAERAMMNRVKAAFDPHGIMNPGKSF